MIESRSQKMQQDKKREAIFLKSAPFLYQTFRYQKFQSPLSQFVFRNSHSRPNAAGVAVLQAQCSRVRFLAIAPPKHRVLTSLLYECNFQDKVKHVCCDFELTTILTQHKLYLYKCQSKSEASPLSVADFLVQGGLTALPFRDKGGIWLTTRSGVLMLSFGKQSIRAVREVRLQNSNGICKLFSKNQQIAICASRQIYLYDSRLQKAALTLRQAMSSEILALDSSKHFDSVLAVGAVEGSIAHFDIRSPGSPLQIYQHHVLPVRKIKFSSVNPFQFASHDGTSLVLWDVLAYKEKYRGVDYQIQQEAVFLHGGHSTISDFCEHEGLYASCGQNQLQAWQKFV